MKTSEIHVGRCYRLESGRLYRILRKSGRGLNRSVLTRDITTGEEAYVKVKRFAGQVLSEEIEESPR